eukprot:8811221-Pyramimonas_sp.AAC.1
MQTSIGRGLRQGLLVAPLRLPCASERVNRSARACGRRASEPQAACCRPIGGRQRGEVAQRGPA